MALKSTFVADESQQKVIQAQNGYHLVLAPPGCGKTQILTERIRLARADGRRFEDMLCLTFTNRASRGMRERIEQTLCDEDTSALYVGNVHRFCSKMLFENGILPADASVIDDDDAISIIARFLDEDEDMVRNNTRRHREYQVAVHFAAFMYQIEHGHPKSLRMHPECVTAEDISAMQTICRIQQMPFDAAAMIDMYRNPDTYRHLARSDAYEYGDQKTIAPLLRKMETALNYEQYKEENNLLDFEDLLLRAYDLLSKGVGDDTIQLPSYSWIQIDEVQDLNPMQLTIIDLITTKPEQLGNEGLSVMYLGDEQQAIFSFMGAKLDTLQTLKQRCEGHIHHLSVNHRSPRYLLNFFNTYAEKQLMINPSLLPTTDFEPQRIGNELAIMASSHFDNEFHDVAQRVEELSAINPDDTTAVIVSSNADAERISSVLDGRGVSHFRVSGDDMFASPEVKLLLAHLTVLTNEHNFIAWSRLLKGLHVYEQNAASRNFVRQLIDAAMLPSDLMCYDSSSYLLEFIRAYEEKEIVVFDTETTGLNILEDDIVQIAAIKMMNGRVVPGSELSLFISTNREIPAMLGDIVNPIIEERRHHTLLSPADALGKFMQYVGDDVLLGHNVQFDYGILMHNLMRYLPDVSLQQQCTNVIDSLKLARLLLLGERQYKLKHLLAALGLEGENSHLADDDVAATANLVVKCYELAKQKEQKQRELLALKSVKDRALTLRNNYKYHYLRAKDSLLCEGTSIVEELEVFYKYLFQERIIDKVAHFDYFIDYLSNDLITNSPNNIYLQLGHHLMEITTLKEADLCGSESVKAKVFVTTVHKAKGLEFDNVIVFDSIEGRYPSFFSKKSDQIMEDARKFYVAMTRSRKRIIFSMTTSKNDYHNQSQACVLTRFLTPMIKQLKTEVMYETQGGSIANSPV